MAAPAFTILFVFHKDIDLLEKTLPQTLAALTQNTAVSYEVILVADGTDLSMIERLVPRLENWGVDELRFRRRERFVASGAGSNNAHMHQFKATVPYLIHLEDDILVFNNDPSFDVLRAAIELFERHHNIPVIFKMNDYESWSWKLSDVSAELEPGVRSVNRVSTHFIIYHSARFYAVSKGFGAFDSDVFIDRDDLSYNWEDLVSHVGTTGGRAIAFPEAWPLVALHCDRKIAPGSMYNTQDVSVKLEICNEYLRRYLASDDNNAVQTRGSSKTG